MDDEARHTDPSPLAAIARDWVVRLASGEVSEGDMVRFKAWRAADPANRAAFDEARALWHETQAVQSAFAQTGLVTPWRRHRGVRAAAIGGALAASLAVMVAFDDLKTAAFADYSTAQGAQRTVSLGDGSTAYLNTESAIAVFFSAAERRVELLHGEVYFDVAPDSMRPFRVAARGGMTQAVGTAFVVRENGLRVTVSVTHGIVRVRSPENAGTNAAGTLTAQAGQRVAYREGVAPWELGAVAAADAAPWRGGRIVIDNLPFADAIAELDRYRPGRVVLLGDKTRYRPVSGVFEVGRLDEALVGLAATQGLRPLLITPYLLVLQ